MHKVLTFLILGTPLTGLYGKGELERKALRVTQTLKRGGKERN